MPEKKYIELQAAVHAINKAWDEIPVGANIWPALFTSALESLPSADVQPVVRCENCQYCCITDRFEYWCRGFCSPARLVRHDDFCSHGEKRGGEQNGV